MTSPVPEDAILSIISKRLRHSLGDRLMKVILFGSRARGTHEVDSDYDLLVVVRETSDPHMDSVTLYRLLADLPIGVDIIIMPEEEYLETCNVIGGLAYPAHREGLVLDA